jgi:hypothetical protein
MVEVEIAGVKYSVAPEMAEAMQKEQGLMQQQLEAAKQTAEAYKLKAQQPIAPAEPKDPAEPANTNYGDRIFEDPDGVINDLTRGFEKIIDDKLNERDVRAQQAAGLEQFYGSFFETNPELKPHEKLVRTILQSNYGEWQHYTVDQVSEKLATESRDTIMPNMGQKQTPDSGIVVESGGHPPAPIAEPAPKDDGKPTSLSDTIKRRQQARRDQSRMKTPGT